MKKVGGAGCMEIPARTEKLRLLFPGKLLEPSGASRTPARLPSQRETNAYFPAAFAFAASIFALIFAGSSGFSFSARSQYWIASA